VCLRVSSRINTSQFLYSRVNTIYPMVINSKLLSMLLIRSYTMRRYDVAVSWLCPVIVGTFNTYIWKLLETRCLRYIYICWPPSGHTKGWIWSFKILRCALKLQTHAHAHTHIYIYIYMDVGQKPPGKEPSPFILK